jgi:serine/threonine protein kinase
MSSAQSNEASIFNAARKIDSQEERDAYLNQSCGDDADLRKRVEKLLAAYIAESQFLEQPAANLDATVINEVQGDLAASMDAGLAPAFGGDAAVVIGSAGHSVLKSLGDTVDMPHVALRDPAAESDDPITRPQSPEMPDRDSDSRYQLQGEIARGGMGAIIKGRDTDLGRDLAIKVLLDSHKDKPEVIQRFVEEAQIGGQLQHPGIAPVYELGQFSDQRPFFAMKLVKGETLAKLMDDREDAAEERGKFIGIFEQICQTMAYAHSRGVIHRDLKPANIMVGAFGEVQVMDWGLAKVLQTGGVADEKKAKQTQQGHSIIQTMRSAGSDVPGSFGSTGSDTQMGSVMGTPAYMPPEQALGEIDQMNERADVFGLGAILCEILTGKPPYVGDDGTQVYRLASRGKLEDCFERLDACEADAELITLTRHCLEVEPTDRPGNAGVLAESVSGYLESVETKLRETELEKADAQVRAEELKRRNKLALTAGTAIVATLLIGISVSLWQMGRATKAESSLTKSLENLAIKTQNEKATQAKEAEDRLKINQQLSDTLTNVGQLQSKAEQAGIDDTAAWAAVSQAVERTKTLLGSDLISEVLQDRAAEALALLDKTNRDRNMILVLEEIRLEQAATNSEEGRFAQIEVIPKYQTAFVKYGLDENTLSSDRAAKQIQACSPVMRKSLIAGLDEWCRLETAVTKDSDGKTQRCQWIAAVISETDSNPWRNQARRAMQEKDFEALRSLCKSVDVSKQTPQMLVTVAKALARNSKDKPAAIEMLERARNECPDDFWVNSGLGHMYGNTDPPQYEKSIRCFMAAAAIRPNSGCP